VARILGLGTILNNAKTEAEAALIKDHLVQTSKELDGILNDLSLTIQIKRMENESLQPVDLSNIFLKVKNILLPELQKCNAVLQDDLTAKKLNTISAYVESILYNLISNAIKYRNPERGLNVRVTSVFEGEYLKLEVQDNGLGIDLEKHKDSLFNMYKRFHFHVEGKGLGLYLVKTQVNLLGGDISVGGKVGEGTLFIVRVKHHNVS
jgi:signal transduction histidine kinase